MSPKGATSFPDWGSYEYDQIKVSFCLLFRFIELCIFLCRLVSFVSTLAKWLAGKTYSHDIWRVEGFPYKDQTEESFIVMVYSMYSQYVSLSTFSLISPFLTATYLSNTQYVWRLRGNIIRTVLCICNVLPLLWAHSTETVHTAGWALSLPFYMLNDLSLFAYVLFYLGHLSHFSSCFVAGVTNLNEPPSSFFAPFPLLRVRSWLHPFRAIVNKKQCETRGLFMSLVIHYWIWDVQDSQGVSIPQNANYNF